MNVKIINEFGFDQAMLGLSLMELKEKYDFTCAKCGHEMFFKPSLSMQFGINSGHATCSKCDEFLHVEIDMQKNIGISQSWDKHLEDIKKENYNASKL